jgi:hypothetical protein
VTLARNHRNDPKGRTMTMTESVVTAESVKAHYEDKLSAALEDWRSAPRPAVAELQGWWDLLSIGPIQIITNPPFAPSDVIRSGERAFVLTIVVLNPAPILPPGVSPCDILSDFVLPFEVTYQTGNITTWTSGPANVNTEHNLTLSPGQCFYVDVLEFVPDERDEVMFEMNVSARIFGCNENYAPPFAGFAREVVDIDSSIFTPPPGLVGAPIRYLVYGEPPTPPA